MSIRVEGTSGLEDIVYMVSPTLTDGELNDLFTASWPNHSPIAFAPILSRSLTYVAALQESRLVGFVNLAWDGGVHAFLLDTTVHPDLRHRGIGQQLVRLALQSARGRGIRWVHVDYEPHLEGFYRGCGFTPTLAGLVNLALLESTH